MICRKERKAHKIVLSGEKYWSIQQITLVCSGKNHAVAHERSAILLQFGVICRSAELLVGQQNMNEWEDRNNATR
jgi:hypothetical protein